MGSPGKPTYLHLLFSNFIPLLGQWFSSEASFAPRGHLTMSGNILGCHNRGGVLLSLSE